MVWSSFAAFAAGCLEFVQERKTSLDYQGILKPDVLPNDRKPSELQVTKPPT